MVKTKIRTCSKTYQSRFKIPQSPTKNLTNSFKKRLLEGLGSVSRAFWSVTGTYSTILVVSCGVLERLGSALGRLRNVSGHFGGVLDQFGIPGNRPGRPENRPGEPGTGKGAGAGPMLQGNGSFEPNVLGQGPKSFRVRGPILWVPRTWKPWIPILRYPIGVA